MKLLHKILTGCFLMFISICILSIFNAFASSPFFMITKKNMKKSPKSNNTVGLVLGEYSEIFEISKSQPLLIKVYDPTRFIDVGRPIITEDDPDYEHIGKLMEMGRMLSNSKFELISNNSSTDPDEDHDIIYLGEKRQISKTEIIDGLEISFEINVGEKIDKDE